MGHHTAAAPVAERPVGGRYAPFCAMLGSPRAGLSVVRTIRGLRWCAHGAVTVRRGGGQRGRGRWRGLWRGAGAQRGCVGAGRVRGGRSAVISAHASAYVAIGHLALCMDLGHGGHRWYWGRDVLLRLLQLLLLRASHTAISRHFLGRRRRLCYVACHAVRQLRICVPECVVCKGRQSALVAVQSPIHVMKAVECARCGKGRCKRVNGFYSINPTKHLLDGALLRMPLISRRKRQAPRLCRSKSGQWTLFLLLVRA